MLLAAADVQRTVTDAAYVSVVARMFRREVGASRLTEVIKAICSFRFSSEAGLVIACSS